jgi:hypothetical protein
MSRNTVPVIGKAGPGLYMSSAGGIVVITVSARLSKYNPKPIIHPTGNTTRARASESSGRRKLGPCEKRKTPRATAISIPYMLVAANSDNRIADGTYRMRRG